jgi:hypothetical protein
MGITKRQIRTPTTTFSFAIIEDGALGRKILDILKYCKPVLAFASRTWSLPRAVRCTIENLSIDRFACKYADPQSHDNIKMNLTKIHELETMCDEQEFRSNVVCIFLHECAHFKTRSDEEAEHLVDELVLEYVTATRGESTLIFQRDKPSNSCVVTELAKEDK